MSYDGSSGSEQNIPMKNKRRICHRLSTEQTKILEAYFKKCPHPDESERHTLCKKLKLDIVQIKFWFQNKRTYNKALNEKSTNILLRGENEKLRSENEAMSEALKNVCCPPCGGPAFGEEERNRNLAILRQENTFLKAVLINAHKYKEAMKNVNLPTIVDSFAAAHLQQVVATRTLLRTDPRNDFECSPV